jgi:hypothetical protein
VVAHAVGHGAQQKALGAGEALVADDDQLGALLLGHVEDRVGRVALAGVDDRRDARRLRLRRRLAEVRVDLLAAGDVPLVVSRSGEAGTGS